jgi:outer membrane protein assembly factor BamB
MYAFHINDGSLLWFHNLNGASIPAIYNSPAVGGVGAVYFTTDTGSIWALDVFMGHVLWSQQLNNSAGSNGQLTSPVVTPNGTLVFG